jgi:glycerol-3-phosphate dehydrogenase (NAD+)
MNSVGIIGSGNWGTTIARVIAENVVNQPDFEKTVRMWVFDEVVDGESLVKTINTKHENVKYLPGYPLPESIVAIPDVVDVAEKCNLLVFVIPHQFLDATLKRMIGHIRPNTAAISLIKGITFLGESIELVSDTIERTLSIKCGGLMGANIANDIAARDYCESTLVYPDPEVCGIWLRALESPYFHVERLEDIVGLQVFGTIKNVIVMAGGLVDGLGYGQSTKAAVLRQGLVEMYKFAEWAFPNRGVSLNTLLASCGFGDVVASSYGGRNRRCAEAFARTGKDFKDLEIEMLNGQKLAGIVAAEEMFRLVTAKNATHQFPFFTTLFLICTRKVPVNQILCTLLLLVALLICWQLFRILKDAAAITRRLEVLTDVAGWLGLWKKFNRQK